ncbi:hypothetical protein GCM10011344_31640 [Dokdonia pacifica]|uniref:Uncharacterized protein n=1 Tax=Dokdonia pacifica TaxID=1627892 RepID=A0A239BPA1_9FLAO|nr:hypothetical protein [Dokdonia pacifica]GGG28548.1 hypothetical protein GCM10011344_31640 [Dokdonia pacifica]SNS09191.1 hypothetical protein SAMN06265376_106305 [Dokdonia pacifica]
MKNLYQINKWWIITTSILYLSIIGMIIGGLFQAVLGVIQLISFGIYIFNWEKIATPLKPYFIIYGILISLLVPYYCFVSSDVFLNTLIGYSGILAFYFLFLSYKQHKHISI